jgi:hypothetical protein
MEKSQLSQLIFSFTSAEKREARKFLESPFFNQRRDVVQLFDWFCANDVPEKTAAKRHLFGADDVNDQELRLRMTYLHRLLERYIAQKEMEADDTNLRLHLAAGYRKRGLGAQFERVRKGIEKALENSPLRDARHHEQRFRLYWEAHQLAHDRNPDRFRAFANGIHGCRCGLSHAQTAAYLPASSTHNVVFRRAYGALGTGSG